MFKEEPVSFKYPRHAVYPITDKVRDIELLPFKQRELARLVKFETRDVTYHDFAPGPFKDYKEALKIGQLNTVERSRVYTIAGARTEVVVLNGTISDSIVYANWKNR